MDHPVDGGKGRGAAHRRQRLVHHPVEDLRRRLPRKRRGADEELEQDGAHGEQVRSRVERIPRELFGRHVMRRADHRPGHGDAGMCLVVCVLCGAGQTEVEQLHAVWREEDVGWLQVAMDDPARVNRGERREDGPRDVGARGERNRPARQPCRHGLAVEQLHRDEELPVRLADLVQLADVGVRHARGGARLAPESLARLGITAGAAHHLDCDLAMEALVGRGIDDPHPSFAKLRPQSVLGNRVRHVRRRFYTSRQAGAGALSIPPAP